MCGKYSFMMYPNQSVAWPLGLKGDYKFLAAPSLGSHSEILHYHDLDKDIHKNLVCVEWLKTDKIYVVDAFHDNTISAQSIKLWLTKNYTRDTLLIELVKTVCGTLYKGFRVIPYPDIVSDLMNIMPENAKEIELIMCKPMDFQFEQDLTARNLMLILGGLSV